jgi:hypothetical protein
VPHADGPGRRGRRSAYPSPVALEFETRASDSPWVDTVWTCMSEQVTQMTSVAAVCWGLVFWERAGRAHAGISGPETRAGTAPVPEGATFLGIEFAVGTSLRAVPGLEYFDEPHLARALRRYVGRTARRLREGTGGPIALDLDQPTTS